jgi:N-hydroxyarylamine O-acetyltransferase
MTALSPQQFDAWCRRIGYGGPLRADLATLTALHAAHSAAIPFENIDVQLGREPSRALPAVFAKLVEGRRGGWCHEQNTLFGAALATIGFGVQRLSAGVARPGSDAPSMGSHLALKVLCEGTPWLVDVGFGSWVGAPVPLEPGHWPLVPWPIDLTRDSEGRWWLGADLGTHRMAYVFADAPGDEDLMAQNSRWQAYDAGSPFVQNLVVQRRIGQEDWTLRGRVLAHTSAARVEQTLIADAAELVRVLRDRFGLDVPEAANVWPAICARHEALFA